MNLVGHHLTLNLNLRHENMSLCLPIFLALIRKRDTGIGLTSL